MPKHSKIFASPNLCLAQINTTVGDFSANQSKIEEALLWARSNNCQVVIFPEMTVSGYPAEDLLLKSSFLEQNLRIIQGLAPKTKGMMVVVGFAQRDPKSKKVYNSAAIYLDGKIHAIYQKNKLPNYGVFDERRYFSEGSKPCFFKAFGVRWGISICEDIWDQESFVYQKKYTGKVDCLINISASPYCRGKLKARKDLLKKLSRATRSWVVYLNLVGGQDELVFDGGSLLVDPKGNLRFQAKQFQEELLVAPLMLRGKPSKSLKKVAPLSEAEEVYEALKLGVRDYVGKNGFRSVVMGLSGGIDSALVAAIAVDALGPEKVHGVTMPSPYTSPETYQDSKGLAKNLGIRCLEFRIDSLLAEYKKVLQSVFAGLQEDVTEENLQARIRGTLLMALSNKFGHLLLTTGNKSEVATGYCTLYGDMAGGFGVLKDVPKTLVFGLAQWRNRIAGQALIPQTVLDRPPSAELRYGQKDQDSLPPYALLDQLIDAYVEHDQALRQIKIGGLSHQEIYRVLRLIDASEYKRRQAAPGIKITPRAFGRDRRMPITNRYIEKN